MQKSLNGNEVMLFIMRDIRKSLCAFLLTAEETNWAGSREGRKEVSPEINDTSSHLAIL